MAKLNNSAEIWKEIPGYDGRYFISNEGRIGRVRSIIPGISNTRCYKPRDRDKILKPRLIPVGYSKGYYAVFLYKDGIAHINYIHRLKAQAFVPNPDNLPEVNHDDGDTWNNETWNLKWCTKKENINHAWDTGLVKRDAGRATPKIIAIVQALAGALSQGEIGKMVKLDQSTVSRIIHGKRQYANHQNQQA